MRRGIHAGRRRRRRRRDNTHARNERLHATKSRLYARIAWVHQIVNLSHFVAFRISQLVGGSTIDLHDKFAVRGLCAPRARRTESDDGRSCR